MAECRVDAGAAGAVTVSGELTFETVPDVWERHRRFANDSPEIVIDLQNVSRADSAALVLLLEWMRAAREQGKQIHFRNIPERLLAVARVSNLDRLLPVQD